MLANVFRAVLGEVANDWITIREAAELTGYHKDYIATLVRRGKLRNRKKEDGKLWVSKAEVAEYAERYAKNPPDGFILVSDACKITGYSQPTLSRLAREQLVRSEICRGKTYVNRQDVVEYARQHGHSIVVEGD